MANRPIFQVDIDDSKFVAFKRKFDEYQQQLGQQQSKWTGINEQLEIARKRYDDLVKRAAEVQEHGTSSHSAMSGISAAAYAAGGAWVSIARTSGQFFRNIDRATFNLAKWGTLTALFSGLMGAGGLWGLSRLASSAAFARQTAGGLGTTYGGMTSSAVNFGRLGDVSGILGAFSTRLHTIGEGRWPLTALGVSDTETDPNRALVQVLPTLKRLVDAMPENAIGNIGRARGWDQLGIDLPFMKRLRSMSTSEVQDLQRNQQRDETEFKLTDQQLLNWQNFNTALERSEGTMRVALMRGLVNLTPGLTHLSKSLVRIIDKIANNPKTQEFVKEVGTDLQKFSDWLGGPDAKSKMKDWISKLDLAKKDFDNLNKWFASHIGGLVAIAAAVKLAGPVITAGGVAVGIGTALGRGISVGGAALGGVVAGTTAWGEGQGQRRLRERGRLAMQQMSPAEKREMIRNSPLQFWKTRRQFGHPPIGDAEHHPYRYQGKMTIDGQTFDYASGGGGRGSSPYGDHPITGWDSSALRGRGAFRTQDMFDPQTGDTRGAVEIHMSRASDVNDVETAGCYGIPASEWPAAKVAIQRFLRNHPEGATLRVNSDGSASIISTNDAVHISRGDKMRRNGDAGSTNKKTAADVMESILNLHDHTPKERELLKTYLRKGGHGMDPATTAWCAAVVGSSLKQAGYEDIPASKGGDIAASYSGYGMATDAEHLQRGDIILKSRQENGVTKWHTEIAAGSVKNGKVETYSGDIRDDPESYSKNPGSAFSTTSTGKPYEGGHHSAARILNVNEEGLQFRHPVKRIPHPASSALPMPSYVTIHNYSDSHVA